MRKFRQLPRRRSRFRSLLILAGALTSLAAVGPYAKADLIAYFNFEGPPTTPYPVNLQSQVPPGIVSTTLILTDENGNPYPAADTAAAPGIPLNMAPGDPDLNLTSLGIRRTEHDLNMDIPLFSSQGIYGVESVSFAYRAERAGYAFVQLQFSSNGGITFQNISGLVALPPTSGSLVVIQVPNGTTINVPNLVLRLQFTGGKSGGENPQDLVNTFDNLQIRGYVIPEPGTVAGGLFGVLALCWHQRRRLIHAVRFRRS